MQNGKPKKVFDVFDSLLGRASKLEGGSQSSRKKLNEKFSLLQTKIKELVSTGEIRLDSVPQEKQIPKKILVIGGGDLLLELSLISLLKIRDYQITNIDPVQRGQMCPKISQITGYAPDALKYLEVSSFDLAICIGASRYFEDLSATFIQIAKLVKDGHPLIFDFAITRDLRRATSTALRNYLLSAQDQRDLDNRIDELITFSLSLNNGLKSLPMTEGFQESWFSDQRNFKNAQELLYECILPFWFKEGTSREMIEALTLWQILCRGEVSVNFDFDELLKISQATQVSRFKTNFNTLVIVAKKMNKLPV